MTKLIRPIMYYCRDPSDNDARFIIQRMRVIPAELQREVTNHYEKLVKPNDGYSGRKVANTYLDNFASEYRAEVKERVIKLKEPPKVVKPGKREIKSKCGLWSKEI